MVTLGSCGTCGATGLIAGGAMFCLECNGHGARYACHNPVCAAAVTSLAPVEDPLVAEPSGAHVTSRSAPPSASPPSLPSVSEPPPQDPRGHRFRNGRCENCGELQMLAASQGWPCKEPFYVW